jgi:hypothetical protein
MENLKEIKNDILTVIRLSGTSISEDQIEIVDRGIPHKPSGLPSGKMGIYSFLFKNRFLKIGKAGPKSDARFRSQHYIPTSSQSNLSKSILKDAELNGDITVDTVGSWIMNNTRRIDFLIDSSLGVFVLSLIEAFLQLRFAPKYEGFENQKKTSK